MDINYSWSQVEHRGKAQNIWCKVLKNILINKINNQATNNLHNYPYFQNEMPIYATINGKESIHNQPFKIADYYANDANKKSDIFTPQILDLIKRKREYNKASTFGSGFQMEIGMLSSDVADKYPWIPNNKIYQKSLKGLHEEILDFYNYIMPTSEEKCMRIKVVERLRTVVYNEWPEAQVDVFGSFKTDLHLPTSDIDVVIFGNYENPLWKLSEIIKRSGISSDCKVLDKATVPIVKMTDKETDVRIDISFNMKNGIKSANLIKGYIEKYPKLPHLVLLLKQYLLQRDLNEVWTGGISSYSLILMCVSFMKHYNKGDLSSKENSNNNNSSSYNDSSDNNMCDNLGELFISFLEMYGRTYDYVNTGIRTEGDICYVPKEDILKNMDGSHWSSILCIEDPLNPGNDIGRSSYGALHVKLALEYAYRMLFNVVLPQSAHLYENQVSILGRIIRITPEVVHYRNFIKAKFSDKICTASLSTDTTISIVSEANSNPIRQSSGPISIMPLTAECPSPNSVSLLKELDSNSNNNNPKTNYMKICESISEKGDVPSNHMCLSSSSVHNKRCALSMPNSSLSSSSSSLASSKTNKPELNNQKRIIANQELTDPNVRTISPQCKHIKPFNKCLSNTNDNNDNNNNHNHNNNNNNNNDNQTNNNTHYSASQSPAISYGSKNIKKSKTSS